MQRITTSAVSLGKSHAVKVEVRKKRAYVKRSDTAEKGLAKEAQRKAEEADQEAIEVLRKQEELTNQYDANKQDIPCIYQVGRHANETLAIRYGIANLDNNVTKEANKIRIQKTRKVKKDIYEVLLTDFRNRKALAVIEQGTRYIKTFLPLDSKKWFSEHKELELTLKGNKSFTLKELATFHVYRTAVIRNNFVELPPSPEP